MSEHVTIGVPVYRGELFLQEALRTVQNQTHKDFDVLISLDGPDPACEAICSEFLNDSRFKLVVQPERMGFAENIRWLKSQATGDFWYYQQQDDLISENYLEVLIEHARSHPEAALVYCDIDVFWKSEGGVESRRLDEPSVLGESPFIRQLALLHESGGVPFRGLTRAEAMRQAGILTNDFENFAIELAWLAGVALSGELHRLPLALYRKRVHGENLTLKVMAWPREKRLGAWAAHCVNMAEQALRVEGTAQELRLLWLACIERLTSPRTAGWYIQTDELTQSEREALFASFIQGARASSLHDIPRLLESDWDDIEAWSSGFFGRKAGTASAPRANTDGSVRRLIRRLRPSA